MSEPSSEIQIRLNKAFLAIVQSLPKSDGTLLASQETKAALKKAEALIEKGAQVNFKDLTTGNTPLYCAVQQGNLNGVHFLLLRGAKIGEESEGGNTPLHGAVKKDHVKIAELLIQAGAPLDVVAFGTGLTPLIVAMLDGSEEMVSMLIKAGASLSQTNEKGWCPFIWGLLCAQVTEKKLQILIAHQGGRVSLDNRNNFNLICPSQLSLNEFEKKYRSMKSGGREKMQRRLRALLNVSNLSQTPEEKELQERIQSFHQALTKGDVQRVKGIWDQTMSERERRALVCSRGAQGQTPLHLAVKMMNMELIRLFLKAGALTYAIDGSGQTAYDWTITPFKKSEESKTKKMKAEEPRSSALLKSTTDPEEAPGFPQFEEDCCPSILEKEFMGFGEESPVETLTWAYGQDSSSPEMTHWTSSGSLPSAPEFFLEEVTTSERPTKKPRLDENSGWDSTLGDWAPEEEFWNQDKRSTIGEDLFPNSAYTKTMPY